MVLHEHDTLGFAPFDQLPAPPLGVAAVFHVVHHDRAPLESALVHVGDAGQRARLEYPPVGALVAVHHQVDRGLSHRPPVGRFHARQGRLDRELGGVRAIPLERRPAQPSLSPLNGGDDAAGRFPPDRPWRRRSRSPPARSARWRRCRVRRPPRTAYALRRRLHDHHPVPLAARGVHQAGGLPRGRRRCAPSGTRPGMSRSPRARTHPRAAISSGWAAPSP